MSMSEEERFNHEYLGDAVYAEWDGFVVWLRTGDHLDICCDDKIYLEPHVLKNLDKFLERMKDKER